MATSETKLSQDAAYQNGMNVYGGNNPIIYTSLMATVSQQPATSNLDVKTIKTTISVKDSSGLFLDFSRVGDIGMIDSPHDSSSQTVDWLNLLADLYNFLAATNHLPASPNLPNGLTATGWGSDSSSFWAKWCTADLLGNCGSLITYTTDKAISFRYQLNFPRPDVYTISISTYVELGVGIGLLTSCCTATWSYSFKYIYESDANSGNDAGNIFGTALIIAPSNYGGLLYDADGQDWYQIYYNSGQQVTVSMTSPAGSNFDLAIYDPSNNYVTGSFNGVGFGQFVSFQTALSGYYRVEVDIASGSGTYQFCVSPPTCTPDFSLTGSPSSLCLYPGVSSAIGLSLRSINGYAGKVGLSFSMSPSNSYVWADFRDTTKSTATISVPAGASASSALDVFSSTNWNSRGSYTITITGASGSLSHSISVALTVDPFSCPYPGGPGGGSVAAGTSITLADGRQVPVQNLGVGVQLLSYDLSSHQYVDTTITRFYSVVTDNQMVIMTRTGKPLIVDQNPAQELYVLLPDGHSTLLPVTSLRVGYSLYDALGQSWVPITSIQYQNNGQHTMYDVYTTTPGSYIANGYLDPQKT
jgi:hypothetical protein